MIEFCPNNHFLNIRTTEVLQKTTHKIFCSAKPILGLGHHELVWLVGSRMAGFVLSGSGIIVFVLGNMGLG